MRHSDIQNLNQAQCQIYQAVDAVLGIADQYEKQNLEADEDLGLELVVFENQHAFLHLVRLEIEQHIGQGARLVVGRRGLTILELAKWVVARVVDVPVEVKTRLIDLLSPFFFNLLDLDEAKCCAHHDDTISNCPIREEVRDDLVQRALEIDLILPQTLMVFILHHSFHLCVFKSNAADNICQQVGCGDSHQAPLEDNSQNA